MRFPARPGTPDWPRKVKQAVDGLEARFETATDWSALDDYADDTAAAAGGIAMGELYRTGSFIKVRVPVPFSPALLFAGGEEGVWYDPSDLSTVWQDTAGTVAGAVGQPVARIDDKSGNGFHATQATAGSRPTLGQDGSLYYLNFDGTDDGLATASINFTATNKMSVFVGLRKTSGTAIQAAIELSATGFNSAGAFSLLTPGVSGGTVTDFGTRLTNLNRYRYTEAASPVTMVYTGLADGDIGGGSTPSLRRDGTLVGAKVDSGNSSGNFGNYPLYIGRRGGASLPFNGRIYGLIVRGALTSGDDLTDTEAYMAGKTGT